MKMLRLLACSLALAAALPASFAGPNWAAGAGLGLGGERNVAVRLSAIGTVTAVDAPNRLVGVNGPRGVITFRLDPKVANADRIRVGERVSVDYVAGMVVSRRNSDEAREQLLRSKRRGGETSLADAYERPITFLTEVLAVNRDDLSVRLRGMAGEVQEYWVSDRADLSGMKAGDFVLVAMNQAVAVDVKPLPQ